MLIRTENKRMQLCLQLELAEEIHNHFIHWSHRGEHHKCTSQRKNVFTLNL